MSRLSESEKRQFVRVPVNVPVDYRFVRQDSDTPISVAMLNGHTINIGAGGLLLVGQIPDRDLIADLLMRKVVVALSIRLPRQQPIQALGRVAWVEAIDQTQMTCSIGLTFKEITAQSQDDLFRFIINAVSG